MGIAYKILLNIMGSSNCVTPGGGKNVTTVTIKNNTDLKFMLDSA